MNRGAVIIFTRLPIKGQTKSRLRPYLSDEDCALLHRSLLLDISNELNNINADIFVSFTANKFNSAEAEEEYREAEKWLKDKFSFASGFIEQRGNDLGERMLNSFEDVFSRGYESVILTGSDIPDLRLNDFRLALHLLDSADAAFGPTVDGGYYLVGFNRRSMDKMQAVFDVSGYGTKSVFEQTKAKCEELKIDYSLVLTKQDIDMREDILDFLERAKENKQLLKTQTHSFLTQKQRISIIVPVYNEEKTLPKLIEQLKKIRNEAEIIFVDAGSSDRSAELISRDFELLTGVKGRAEQMNFGAKMAKGDILFFLHCDSVLPKNALSEIRQVLKRHRAGCFGIAFKSFNPLMHICAFISNLRIRDRKVMFGDQGIFIERRLFEELNGFPRLPIMEDYQFSLQLKERFIRLGVTRHRIITSDRRFPRNNIEKLKLMWKMNRLRQKYRDLVSVSEISSMYKDIR